MLFYRMERRRRKGRGERKLWENGRCSARRGFGGERAVIFGHLVSNDGQKEKREGQKHTVERVTGNKIL